MRNMSRMKICCFWVISFPVWTMASAYAVGENAPIVQEYRPILTVQSGHPGGICCSAISTDGLLGLTGGGNGEIWLWDLKTCKGLHRYFLTDAPTAIAFCAKGNQMLTAETGNVVNLWDMASEKIIRSFPGHGKPITSMCISADGRYLLSGSRDKTARLWDVSTGAQLQLFPCQAEVHCVDISTDRRQAIAASADGVIHMWNTASGEEIRRFEGHDGIINCLRFAADGKHILSGGAIRRHGCGTRLREKKFVYARGILIGYAGSAFFPMVVIY